MASSAETSVTGSTAFEPAPAPGYHYEISFRDNKLKIWLEDQTSKKQWCTDYLSEDQYISTTNRAANATVTDYIAIFKDALDYMMDTAVTEDDTTGDTSGESSGAIEVEAAFDTQRIRRKLLFMENRELQLELTLKFKVLRSARAAKFVFHLQPLSLDRFDRLQSKLQEVEQRLAQMEQRSPSAASNLEVRSVCVKNLGKRGFIKWQEIKEGDFALSARDYGGSVSTWEERTFRV